MQKKSILYFVAIWLFSSSDSIPQLAGLLLMLGLLFTKVIRFYQQKKFKTAMASFLKLKVVHKDFTFLYSINRHRALIEKLSGKNIENREEKFSLPYPSSYPLIRNLQEIFNTLNKIHDSLEMKIFTLPVYQVTENNIGDYLEEIPFYLHQCVMELELNWLAQEELLVRWRILKTIQSNLAHFEEVAHKLRQQSEEYMMNNSAKFNHQFFEQLENLKIKLVEDHSFSLEDVQEYIELITKVQRYLQNEKKVLIREKAEIQIFQMTESLPSKTQKTEDTQKVIKQNYEYQQEDRQEFKKKLDNLLVIGMHQRRQKYEQMEEKEQLERQLFKSEVQHDEKESKYEIKQIEEQNSETLQEQQKKVQ